jgi:hypothetical protein
LEKYLSGYLDEELNSIETTSVCVVVFAGSGRVQRADRADEGALGADGAPDAGSARVQMADRASRGALGADGAQDSGADKVRRSERTARGVLRASSVKNDFPTLLSTPKIQLLMILKPLMILTSRSVSVIHVISLKIFAKAARY